MENNRVSNITIENAHILPYPFRNFAGEESKYNAKGKRNFCVELDEETAETLKKDGWNIKYLRPRNPDDDPKPYIQISVSFDNYPPNVYLITNKKKTKLSEDTICTLDHAEIANADLIINPYHWSTSSGSGIKAYLKTLYATLVENEIDKKYYDLEEESEDSPF